MFNQLYDILSNFLFNGDPSAYSYGELICQGIPAVLCSVLVFVPFIVVWRVIKSLL